jgi:hypothetical protein
VWSSRLKSHIQINVTNLKATSCKVTICVWNKQNNKI